MRLKVYLDSDDGEKVFYLKLSGKRLTALISSIIAVAIWIVSVRP